MLSIEHNPTDCYFFIEKEGREAVLKYRLGPDNSIDFYSTFVPEPIRGGSIAVKLVKAGLKWANEQGYEIKASCWFVAKCL